VREKESGRERRRRRTPVKGKGAHCSPYIGYSVRGGGKRTSLNTVLDERERERKGDVCHSLG
jgi:hypothetical protein